MECRGEVSWSWFEENGCSVLFFSRKTYLIYKIRWIIERQEITKTTVRKGNRKPWSYSELSNRGVSSKCI